MGLGHKTFTVIPLRALRFGLDCIYSKYSMCLLYRTQSGLEETEGQLHNGLLSVPTLARFNIQWRQSHKFKAIGNVQYEPLFPFGSFCAFLCVFCPLWPGFCSFSDRFQLLRSVAATGPISVSGFGATGETLGHRVVYLHHCSHN